MQHMAGVQNVYKGEREGPMFAVALTRHTMVLMMSEEKCCTWQSWLQQMAAES